MSTLNSSLPKAVLYYYPSSVWSSAVLLTLEEKGYGNDEVDLRVVDLAKGKNFEPSYLRLNPKATVPTLVVPLEKTLTEDVESRYRAITETKAIIEFLDKSRSATSRTRTTSSAPAPALSPATIAFSAISAKIIDQILHCEEASPNMLRYMNARDVTSLCDISKDLLPYFTGRSDSLADYLRDAHQKRIHVSEKTMAFWRDKKSALEDLTDVMKNAYKGEEELGVDGRRMRVEYLKEARVMWQVKLRDVLVKLNSEIIGPFSLGDQFSVADLHLAAWLARLVKLSGGTAADDGNSAIAKLTAHIEPGFALVKDFISADGQRGSAQSKLAGFWDAVQRRGSWKKVFNDGLV